MLLISFRESFWCGTDHLHSSSSPWSSCVSLNAQMGRRSGSRLVCTLELDGLIWTSRRKRCRESLVHWVLPSTAESRLSHSDCIFFSLGMKSCVPSWHVVQKHSKSWILIRQELTSQAYWLQTSEGIWISLVWVWGVCACFSCLSQGKSFSEILSPVVRKKHSCSQKLTLGLKNETALRLWYHEVMKPGGECCCLCQTRLHKHRTVSAPMKEY